MSAGNKEEEAELNIDQLDTTGFWTHQDEISQTSANKKIISLSKHGPLDDFLAFIQTDSFAASSISIDFDIMDDSGWCPMTHAAFNGHSEIIQNIIAFQEQKYQKEFGEERVEEQRNDTENVEPKGESDKKSDEESEETPQTELRWKQSMKKFLCSKLSYNGSTALHLACARGHQEIAKLLLNKMVKEYKIPPSDSINAVDYDLATPLHCTVLGKHYNVMQLLLMNGAVINKCDRHGKSPMDWAVEHKLHDFMTVFKRYEQSNGSGTPQQETAQCPDLLASECAQSKSVVAEEREFKSMEMSLEDLVVGDLDQHLFRDQEEELSSFRDEAASYVQPTASCSPQTFDPFGQISPRFPVDGNNSNMDFRGMNPLSASRSLGYEPAHNPYGQPHHAPHGFGQHSSTFVSHGFGQHSSTMHLDNQNCNGPYGPQPPYHGHHGHYDHHQQHCQQGYHGRNHNRKTLPYRETAPRHFRYNTNQNKDPLDDCAHSEPPLNAREVHPSFPGNGPELWKGADNLSVPPPVTQQANPSTNTKTTTEWVEDLEMVTQIMSASRSAPNTSPKKQPFPFNISELDLKGLDANGSEDETTGSGSDSMWKSRHDALAKQLIEERERWQTMEQSMTKQLELKQSQVHDLRHKLRRLRRFLDDLPNGIKMRFFKNKRNFKAKAGDDGNNSCGSSASDVVRNSNSRITKTKMEVTPVPNRGAGRGKRRYRPRSKAKMIRVTKNTTTGIKKKKASAG